MKTAKTHKRILSIALSCALGSLASSAMAASTWNFSSCVGSAANQAALNKDTFGNSWSCAGSVAGNKVTASAWGARTQTVNNVTTTNYQTAYLSPQGSSGFGVASQNEGLSPGSPQHAMDNDPAAANTPDLILLKFDTAVALDSITVGWNQSDADITVMAYTGNGGGAPVIQGKTAANLTSGGAGSGWSLIRNLGDQAPDVATSSSSVDITRSNWNSGNVVSSWWLVSAYNSNFGGGGNFDSVLDYVKLFSVASKDVPGQVSEPGTLAMVGIAILGALGVRRRKPASSTC